MTLTLNDSRSTIVIYISGNSIKKKIKNLDFGDATSDGHVNDTIFCYQYFEKLKAFIFTKMIG